MQLSDAALFLSGGTPTKGNPKYWGGNIPWFSAANMNERFLRQSDLCLTSDGLEKGSRLAPKGATLLLVRGSGLFKYIPICFAENDVAFNQDVKAICPKPGIDPLFLHYAIEVQRQTLANNIGVTGIGAGKFDTDFLKKLPFPDIPNEEQPKIGKLASSFDRKIDLNRRMNETLEAMAQAIFRDWFVDFGPVRRKLAGITDPVAIMGGLTPDPARAAELAALFPDRFGEDELPAGWQYSRIESILELAYGKSLPQSTREPGPYPVYGSGGVTGTHSTALVSGPGIIVGRKGTVGSLYWEAEDFFPIDTVFYVIPKNDVPLNFIWHLLHTLGLEGMNTDAAVPGLNRANAYRLEFVFSNMPTVNAFERIVCSLRAKQEANIAENRTLAETRDYLLPRLMSGEVRVGDVAQELAA